ncbi:hypothetical protein J6590_085202 [Homalodisca vitripennis]|nr:hypothetical protein J6590_085202 [Homalodisca vitripennis]
MTTRLTSEISAMYMGTAEKAIPLATPPKNLPTDNMMTPLPSARVSAMARPTVYLRPRESRTAPDTKGPSTLPRDSMEATVLPSVSVSVNFTNTGEDHTNVVPHITYKTFTKNMKTFSVYQIYTK